MLNECLYIKIVKLNSTSNFFYQYIPALYTECSFIKCIIPKVVVVAYEADRTAKVYKFICPIFRLVDKTTPQQGLERLSELAFLAPDED